MKKPEKTYGKATKSLRLLSSDPDLVRTLPFHKVPGKKEVAEMIAFLSLFLNGSSGRYSELCLF